MLAHRLEATVSPDRTLTLENLPFQSGEEVEIIILARPRKSLQPAENSLHGTVLQYVDPVEPVAIDDWDVAQ